MVVSNVAHVAMIIHVYCRSLFKIFNLFHTHVAGVFMYLLHILQCYVVNVCSKCFICFRRMLQLFHLSVAKVDMDVGLLNEEERASAGAIAGSMCTAAQRGCSPGPKGPLVPGCEPGLRFRD
jgi:hypothetical protein